MTPTAVNTRFLATHVMYQVVAKQQHLKSALQHTLNPNNGNLNVTKQEQAWVQNICYQCLRHHHNLSARWLKFTEKPPKDKMLCELLTLSMAQKLHLNTPDHAIVNEAIKTAKKLKKHWASGLLNKILRLALNDTFFESNAETIIHSHPQWWIDLLKKDWPNHWQKILHANNQKPPLWVRVYDPKLDINGFQHPHLKNAWRLTDTQISSNSELNEGRLSVQDAAAQYAAHLLNPQAGEKILDACAAPGGKSCHLLELQPLIKLDILEKESHRLKLIKSNLSRL